MSDEALKVLVDVRVEPMGDLRVLKHKGVYTVEVNRFPKHTDCTADDVIRALGHYIQGLDRSHKG